MIRKGTIWRGSLILGLAAALLATGFGCHPASNSGPAPSTNKPASPKPDKNPNGQPKPDVG